MKFKILAIIAFLLLLPAAARIGVSISPSLGTFTFGSRGGTLQLTVFNAGDEDGTYSFSIEQGGEFAELVKAEEKLTPGTYSILPLKIKPAAAAEFEKAYRLRVVATGKSADGTTLSAVSKLDIIFSAQAAQSVEYASDPTSGARRSEGPDIGRAAPLVIGLVIIVIIAGVYLKIKSSKEEEITVPGPGQWKGP